MSIATRFQFFADVEVHGESPVYEALSRRITEDEEVQGLLEPLPPDPILFFGCVNYLGGVSPDYDEFKAFVVDRWDDIHELLLTRKTQTNEVGRCALFLPAIAMIDGPVALVDVGTSAGLNQLMDRYAYDYGEAGRLGDGDVVLRCEVRGPVPVPTGIPDVVFRKGIDRSPIDVFDDDAVKWLEACIWPGRPDRVEVLRGAVALAREDPPSIVHGDLVDELEGVLDDVPDGATPVVFHSMVLAYSMDKIAAFAEIVRRRNVVWLSLEAPWIIPGVQASRPPSEIYAAFLGRNGDELLAFAHPHGRWLEWVAPTNGSVG